MVQQNEYLLKVNQTDCTWQDISIIWFSFFHDILTELAVFTLAVPACILVGSANTNFTRLNTKS